MARMRTEAYIVYVPARTFASEVPTGDAPALLSPRILAGLAGLAALVLGYYYVAAYVAAVAIAAALAGQVVACLREWIEAGAAFAGATLQLAVAVVALAAWVAGLWLAVARL